MHLSYDIVFVLHLEVASMALISVSRHKHSRQIERAQLCESTISTYLAASLLQRLASTPGTLTTSMNVLFRRSLITSSITKMTGIQHSTGHK